MKEITTLVESIAQRAIEELHLPLPDQMRAKLVMIDRMLTLARIIQRDYARQIDGLMLEMREAAAI